MARAPAAEGGSWLVKEFLTEAFSPISSPGSQILTRYAYDANGNTRSRTNTAESAFYNWSPENRLIAATVTDNNGVTRQLAYAYDDDGIRVGSVVDGVATSYLMDANRPFAQVLEEVNSPSGALLASYTYGQQLISQNRAGISSYYHGDQWGAPGPSRVGVGAGLSGTTLTPTAVRSIRRAPQRTLSSLLASNVIIT